MQRFGDVEVDPASQKISELFFELRQREVRITPVRLELDQHVDVAVGPEIVTKHGAEQRQPPDVMAPAEVGDPFAWNFDARAARRHSRGMNLRLITLSDPPGNRVSIAAPIPARGGAQGARRPGNQIRACGSRSGRARAIGASLARARGSPSSERCPDMARIRAGGRPPTSDPEAPARGRRT